METQRKARIPLRTSEHVEEARQILRGKQSDPRVMLELARTLKAEMRMSYARRLLLRASQHESVVEDKPLRREIHQELAFCTYKDQDLPPDDRFQRALDALNEIDDFVETTDQKTLGLLGAIYERRWEFDNQRQNIERSLRYYLRGYELGPAKDLGSTGINAAFVLDQLADLLDNEAQAIGDSSGIAAANRERACAIRHDIATQLTPDVAHHWGYYATLGEAYFGLKQYDEAANWLILGQQDGGTVYEWELESCARHLATLARFQASEDASDTRFEDTPAWVALHKAFGAAAVPRNAFAGKIGLALSGGGFRASLYHLGVLARLAELDVLRHVEVLSCVSGGSIVGAYYYLMVRHLLQSKTEEEITREHYIEMVKEMVSEFVAGVQMNIRTRVIVNPIENLKMLWTQKYSRTNRAGKLYETCLYSRIKDDERGERWLNELTIAPLTKQPDGPPEPDKSFAPKYQNWRRGAKVPILVLNAATLNTGHTWQFTATWMGESPSGIDSEIDGNDRLRRMYYTEAPEKYRRVRLGDAVGASAAVPGLFEPMTFDNLYPDRIVRLVDGGVCDNQGVGSLFEQDCRIMLISDASGEMESQPAASRGILGVLLRSNDIFQARIREAEYHDLKGRRRSGLLRGLMFVHLKADLGVDPIDWVQCPDPYDASDDPRPPTLGGPLTRYGIPKEVQQLLSGIRTDLDSFSDAEAYALMLSGYRMTEYQFKYENFIEGLSALKKSEYWPFMQIEHSMHATGDAYAYLKTLLKAGGSLAFKVWQIDPWLKYGLRIGLIVLAGLVAVLFWRSWTEPLPDFGITAFLSSLTVGKVVIAGAGLFGGYLITRIIAAAIGDALADNVVAAVRFKDTVRRMGRGAVLSTVGSVAAALHLYVFDRRFLRLGSIATLKKKG